MTYSVRVTELPAWLATETRGANSETAVLAGHFAIYSAGAAALDLLDHAAPEPGGAAEMLDFTRLTWRVACEVARTQPDQPFRLVTLVDDIQYVRPSVTDRATAERLAAALAGDYLDGTRQLPTFHLREIAAGGIPAERILRCREDRWLFSERELRQSAVRHVRQHFSAGGGTRAGLASTDNGNTMTVTLPDQGDYCLVHSGHTTCAGGYVELLSTLYDRGVRKLIAFVPMRCFAQVALGTALAHTLYPLSGFDVVTVAVPDLAISPSVIIDRS